MIAAYYNENDPTAAHVLRTLIKLNVIAPGDVDTRSIKDVQSDDLKSYTQCHFFVGGGLWSVAARLAGWRDDRPLWTGSCPCQPFSQAGQGRGIADERHLWPDFHRLIAARRPSIVVGEQVAGTAGYGWLDGVRSDLGAEGYTSGAVDIPSASVDAPHIRQRFYWVALANAGHLDGRPRPLEQINGQESANDHGLYAHPDRGGCGGRQKAPERHAEQRATAERDHAPGVTLGDAFDAGLEGHAGHGDDETGRARPHRSVATTNGGNMGHTAGNGWQQRLDAAEAARYGDKPPSTHGSNGSFWPDYEWIICHDNKARRTKPGLRLLVDGLPGRMDIWRIAGNAIVAPLAAEVLKALMETTLAQGRAG